MTREQNIFETNNYDGGLLVDRNTNLPVGFTSHGVDQNFVTTSTDTITGAIAIPAINGTLIGKLRVQGFIGHKRMAGSYQPNPDSGSYNTRTYQTITEAETTFYAIRIKLKNTNLTTFTVGPVAIAPSASATTVNPTGSWVNVTFNGASTVTVPASSDGAIGEEVYSDWMSCQSISRSDGGTRPIIYMRAYKASGAGSGEPGIAGFGSGWRNITGDPYTGNRFVRTSSAVGDFVTSNQSSFTDDTGAYPSIIGEFEYLAASRILTVAAVGDSITRGDNSYYNSLSWGFLACADLSTTDKPIQFENLGFSGQTTTQYLAQFTKRIAEGDIPHIAFYAPGSPNDGLPTTAIINTQKFNLAKFLLLCDQFQIFPVLWTVIPRGYTGSNETARTAFNTELLNLKNRGIAVVDFDAVMRDPIDPTINNPALRADGIHPSGAGHVAIATAVKKVIKQIQVTYFGT